MKNKVQLITYADRLGDGTLSSMTDILRTRFDGVYDGDTAARELKAAQQSAKYEAMSEKALAKEIRRLEKAMQDHARNLEFEEAAAARDELFRLKACVFGADGHVTSEKNPPR